MPRGAFAAVLILAGCAGARQRAAPVVVCPPPGAAAGSDTTVYDANAVSQRPVFLSHPRAVYPPLMRENGVSGSVVLDVVIDVRGYPDTASLHVQPVSGLDVEFVPSATAAVLGSRFSPGIRCGHPVRVRVHVPLHYSVDTTKWVDPYHLR